MYFRAGRNADSSEQNKFNVPENYSGLTFNGGLVDSADAERLRLDAANFTADTPSYTVLPHIDGANVASNTDGHDAVENDEFFGDRQDDISNSNGKTARIDAQGKAWRLPDTDELLIIGMILLIYNGTVNEDIITLLILLLF